MPRWLRHGLAAAAALLVPTAPAYATPSSAAKCLALRGLPVSGGKVRHASWQAEGQFAVPGGTVLDSLPVFCRVVASVSSELGSRIVIEIWLPAVERWNGRLLGTGNGGFAGAIVHAALANGIRRGYATANTDMGTAPAASLGPDMYDAGIGEPAMVRDWSHRATHLMTLAAKRITQTLYGAAPRRSYFVGCSTGGHQGLSEAQRHPEDYDGIVAGAPGHNRTHLHAAFTHIYLAAQATPASFIPREKIALVHRAGLAACVGRDGGAPGDRFLTDPLSCRFAPRALLCPAGADKADCLTADQVRTLDAAYDGPRNPRTGARIYFPWLIGSEPQFSLLFGAPGGDITRPPADLSPWAFGANRSQAFDFNRDMAAMDRAIGGTVNALSTDLSRFAARGAKLILYHGWEDGIVSPLDSVAYFHSVRTGKVVRDDALRLYMIPGMAHCHGGDGPRPTLGAEPIRTGADDMLAALELWVEQGIRPGALAGLSAAGEPPATRPICPYPARPRRDADDTTRFGCAAARALSFEWPAPQYLRQAGIQP